MRRIALFASGSGTNVENIYHYFKDSEEIKIEIVCANRPDAYVIKRMFKYNIPGFIFNRDEFYNSEIVLKKLIEKRIDLIVLAGFLWLVPENLTGKFKNRIVNIHPALLPKYGGKGMYGDNVHKAVIENKERESGITIHYVNENYDEGAIIMQKTCDVDKNDTPDSLAEKIHQLEYKYFPIAIEQILRQ